MGAVARWALAVAAVMALWSNARPAAADDDARARDLYLAGEDDYAAGRYEDAADKFEAAYKLSKRPALLFNLGNTYERMGEYERAAKALQAYLDSPDPQRVRETRQRIELLEKRAQDKRKREEELRRLRDAKEGGDGGVGDGDDGGAGDAGTGGGELSDSEPEGPSRLSSYLLVGGGGAALVAGVVFALASSGAGSDAEANCMSTTGGRFCSDAAKTDLDKERNFGIAADVSFVVGFGAVTAGVLLWVLANEPETESEEALGVGPTLVPGGGGLGVWGRF